ncbi:uncharacterized protein M6B38_385580 [Iris pallida]|uniref:Methyltransferase type 11 domain-containing protein n=1 Tax=Iris pallida TaxID=29817 RepID=A0AAX6G2D0_IRIPA|nr:uncharacterized protein M6B38_385580 [Iris pallida]
MDSPAKPGLLRPLLRRLLLLGVLVLAVRFAYVVSINGGSCSDTDFCFFSSVPPAAGTAFLRRDSSVPAAWRSHDWRKAVDYYSSVFQDLVVDGFLSPSSKSLCSATVSGQEVLALKEIGVPDSVGVSKNPSPPLVVSAGDPFRLPFVNTSFDFVFAGRSIDASSRPSDLASELVRVLRADGFLVVLTTSAADPYSLGSLQDLFPRCRKVRLREINGPASSDHPLREIVFQKVAHREEEQDDDGSVNKCSVPEHKLQLVQSAEPLIPEEPLKPWITLKKNIKTIKYLPSVVEINFKRRYVYIDVGARSYGSSIGSWFKKHYPKQNHTFEIFAIEADKEFHKDYVSRKGIKLLPYAAWIRNESLSFEVNHNSDPKSDESSGKGMGRICPSGHPMDGKSSGDLHTIPGIDFAEWVKSTVSKDDFVVMKMDVEGTEFDLIPRLFETGAICLIDELFLECHYNRWQRCCPGVRSPKYENTYGQCLELFTSLRDSGVLVHQWW